MVFHQPLGFSFFRFCFVGGEVIWRDWHVILLPHNAGICLDFYGFSQVGANDNKNPVLTLCSMGSIIMKMFGHIGKVTLMQLVFPCKSSRWQTLPMAFPSFPNKNIKIVATMKGLILFWLKQLHGWTKISWVILQTSKLSTIIISNCSLSE